MGLDALGKELAGAFGAALGEGQEQQTAADFARGVLHHGQAMELGLRPVGRQIVEVLGVGGDLLEKPPGGFDGGQVLLLLVLAPAAMEEAVGAPDALQRPVAEGQIELADQAASAEGG